MFYKIKQFFRRIKLTYDWYQNVLKDDFDWDYVYILRVLQYKLERTKTAIKNGSFQDAEITAGNIQYSIDLLQKIIDDKFDDEEIDKILKKHGILSEDFYNGIIQNMSTCCYTSLNTEYKHALSLSYERREAVIHEFFTHFEKNFQKWWD